MHFGRWAKKESMRNENITINKMDINATKMEFFSYFTSIGIKDYTILLWDGIQSCYLSLERILASRSSFCHAKKRQKQPKRGIHQKILGWIGLHELMLANVRYCTNCMSPGHKMLTIFLLITISLEGPQQRGWMASGLQAEEESVKHIEILCDTSFPLHSHVHRNTSIIYNCCIIHWVFLAVHAVLKLSAAILKIPAVVIWICCSHFETMVDTVESSLAILELNYSSWPG